MNVDYIKLPGFLGIPAIPWHSVISCFFISNWFNTHTWGTITSTRIIVAYVSPRRSTAGIAQAVGKELQSAGYSVDVVGMKSVSSLEGYNAVVIGGPLYMGKVVSDVGKFIGRHRDALAKLPVAVFTVGVVPVRRLFG